jgi:DNA invertase Pin-like site-specific DNA recombinase
MIALSFTVDSMNARQVRELKAQGLGVTRIAKVLSIGRASAYRVLEVTNRDRCHPT